MQAGVYPTLAIDGGVFRAMHLAAGQQLGLHQGVVGLQHAGHRRSRRGVPGQRIDRAGGHGQVTGRCGQEHDDQGKQFLQHCCSSVSEVVRGTDYTGPVIGGRLSPRALAWAYILRGILNLRVA